MTSIWENETFNIPYQMVDLMEQYLSQKCVRFERVFGEFTAKRTPGGLPPDSSSKDALHIYGVNDEMWRTCAEKGNMLFFANNESIYRLFGATVEDIGRDDKGGYYSSLYPALKSIRPEYETPATAHTPAG